MISFLNQSEIQHRYTRVYDHDPSVLMIPFAHREAFVSQGIPFTFSWRSCITDYEHNSTSMKYYT